MARPAGSCRGTLTVADVVRTAVLGWWPPPAAAVTPASPTAARLGTPISAQSLAQRFTPAGSTLLQEVIAVEAVAPALLGRFRAVYLLDRSSVTLPDALTTIWPGCGGWVATATLPRDITFRIAS